MEHDKSVWEGWWGVIGEGGRGGLLNFEGTDKSTC